MPSAKTRKIDDPGIYKLGHRDRSNTALPLWFDGDFFGILILFPEFPVITIIQTFIIHFSH